MDPHQQEPSRMQHAQDAQALADVAVTAAESGQFDAAAQAFAAAIALDGSSAPLHEQHAQCLMELDKYDEAVQAATAATALDPSWAQAWLTLARASLNSGELQAAHEACAKSLELDPSSSEAQEEMDTIRSLLQQHISRLVGLPGLVIAADPGGQTGPGCVVWEAGVHLARLFVQLAALQQRSGGVSMQAPAASEAAASTCGHCQPPAALPPTLAAGGNSIAVGEAPASAAAGAVVPDEPGCVSLSQLPLLRGSRLLELGSGTGIAGIAAAACGAHVLLTDLPGVQQRLRANITRNKQVLDAAGGSAAAAVLDWGKQRPAGGVLLGAGDEQGRSEPPQPCGDGAAAAGGGDGSSDGAASGCASATGGWAWGFGADLVFNAAQVGPAVQAISSFLHPAAAGSGGGGNVRPPSCFLLAHKQRHAELDQQLLSDLAAAGCVAKPVAWSAECSASQVCVWLLVAACNKAQA